VIVQEPDGRVELLEGNFDSSNTTLRERYTFWDWGSRQR
jgi:calcineurin-like phosphoesterase family protein